MVTKQRKLSELSDRDKSLSPVYGRAAMDRPVPKIDHFESQPGYTPAPAKTTGKVHKTC